LGRSSSARPEGSGSRFRCPQYRPIIPAIPKTCACLIPTLTVEQVADALVRAVEGNWRQVIVPFMLWLFAAMYRFFPRPVEWLVHSTGWRRSHG
jgi:hypothetical protein